MTRLKKLIDNRTVGIILHGRSIKELEMRIKEYWKDICWISINQYGLVEHILEPIDKRLSIVYCSSFNELIRRQKDIKKFLKRKEDNLFITTLHATYHLNNEELINKYHDKIIFAKDIKYIGGISPNSLTVLLYSLVNADVKKIILFGADGLLAPVEEKREDGVFISDSYYKKNELRRESREWNLVIDTERFNQHFADTLRALCKDQMKGLEIYNCSPISVLHPHRYNEAEDAKFFFKVDYNQVKKVL